jgi:hypothetical protein
MVTAGYYAKAEFLDIFATHSADTSLTNWKNPGTFNPSIVSAPAFTAYEGYTGTVSGSKYINLNFNPTTNGTLVGQNNICVIFGIGNDVLENRLDFGALAGGVYFAGSSRYSDNFRKWVNSGTYKNTANLNGKKHYAISRGVAANFNSYINLVKTNVNDASTGLINSTLYACGYNNGGAIAASNRQMRYCFMFSYLTEAEVQGVIGLTNTLLTNWGTNLY